MSLPGTEATQAPKPPGTEATQAPKPQTKNLQQESHVTPGAYTIPYLYASTHGSRRSKSDTRTHSLLTGGGYIVFRHAWR